MNQYFTISLGILFMSNYMKSFWVLLREIELSPEFNYEC